MFALGAMFSQVPTMVAQWVRRCASEPKNMISILAVAALVLIEAINKNARVLRFRSTLKIPRWSAFIRSPPIWRASSRSVASTHKPPKLKKKSFLKWSFFKLFHCTTYLQWLLQECCSEKGKKEKAWYHLLPPCISQPTLQRRHESQFFP